MYGGVRCIWSGSIYHNADGLAATPLDRYAASRRAGKERDAPDYDKMQLQWEIRLYCEPDMRAFEDEESIEIHVRRKHFLPGDASTREPCHS